jgi:CheY-like chemotaxis protein
MDHTSTHVARSILIADDQPAFRQLLRQMLAGLAAEFIECGDGAEAVAAFERHLPDWALLDWLMPNLDGVEATRSIRARHPQARVVILSLHFSPLLAHEADNAGACACFSKDQLEDLLALLRASSPRPESTATRKNL